MYDYMAQILGIAFEREGEGYGSNDQKVINRCYFRGERKI